MIPRKNESANIEGMQAHRMFLGLWVTFALLLCSFAYQNYEFEEDKRTGPTAIMDSDIDMVNFEAPPPPPPPPPKVTQTIELEIVEEVEEEKKFVMPDFDPDSDDLDFEEEFEDWEEEEPLLIAEYMPAFGDCKDIRDKMERENCTNSSILSFVMGRLSYPTMAKETNIQGMVIIGFVIDKKGQVTKVECVKPVHPLLDEEAIRVVKLLPDFKPAEQNGKTTAVRYNIPVRFTIR